MSTTKKIKTSQENDQFELVKKYLMDCPHVSKDHPAITAALQAVEKEQHRAERDRKLQMKFSSKTKKNTAATSASDSMSTASKPLSLDDAVVVVGEAGPPSLTPSAEDASDEMMEWQDVPKDKEIDENDASFLGKRMAKIVIDTISENRATAKSPIAAVALALHAALRSDVLGFSCTGIPEDKTASKGGFAAPVRELPKTTFLPPSWDSKSDAVALRYRKAGTGAVVLEVKQEADSNVVVRLQPASSKEPSSQVLQFVLGDHVNLDSWNAAKKAAQSVSPALHYKSLHQLLTSFCRTFDLGAVDGDDQVSTSAVPYVDNTVVMADVGTQPRTAIHKSDLVPPQPFHVPPVGASSRPNWRQEVPSTLGEAFPKYGVGPRGDFAGDLAPAGLQDPRFLPANGGGRMGGNLMGPNHPMFRGGDGMLGPNGLPVGGPGSMQPRFDPMYPMGIHPNGSSKPRSRRGEPNPDHLPPPNAFGDNNNMFS